MHTQLYGQTFACECGLTHRISPEQVLYRNDALEQLPELAGQFAKGRHVAVMYDARTKAVAGDEAAGILRRAGWQVDEFLLEDPAPGQDPACDEPTRQALSARLGKIDLVVPVGSGVLSDLGKLMADERGVRSICVGTAGSMNGYASANVALTVGGLKTLARSHAAAAVLARPRDIENAPYEMTVSGLGDVLAKPVSSADWYLNHLLFDDYYCRRSVELIAGIEPMYFEHPRAILDRASTAIAALFEALLLTGVAMTMAESSAPASGGEHMISHTLDMKSLLLGRHHDLHGRQVGVGTVMAAELYRRVLAVESPDFRVPADGVDEGFWGKLSGAARKEYAGKTARLGLAADKLRQADAWDELRRQLSPMLREPEAIHNCLAAACGAVTASDLGVDKPLLGDCFRHAHEFRSRFTILDLARLTGVLPAAVDEIVEQWG